MMSRAIGVAAILAIAASAFAGESSRVPSKGPRQPGLLSLAGIKQQIRQLPRHVLTGYDKGAKPVSGARQAVVRRIISESMDADRIERRVAARLAKELPKDHSAKVREWLRSDLGRRIAALEEQTWAPHAAARRDAFINTAPPASVSPARLHLLRRLDHAIGTTETLLESAELSAFGAAMTIDSARPAGERVGEDRIRVQIDLDRQANRERWESVTTDTFLHAYRSLSDDELGRYADFLESDEGREYTSVATSALKDALYEGSEALSRGLASPRHASHR